MLDFKIHSKSKKTLARTSVIKTNHSNFVTPVFMPCATNGAVKGISAQELQNLNYQIILGNTYHLYLRPGENNVKKMGGLQKFMGWPGSVLTDSGGFQVFSLGSNFQNYQSRKNEPMVQIAKRGVWFRSHHDGSKHLFTPEKVIDIQLALGSDIIMPLDFCPSADAEKEEIEKAVDTTNIWFKRAWEHFQHRTKSLMRSKKPALFAIIQGGAYEDLRKKSFAYLSQFSVDGFAIGGVANGGESKLKQQNAVKAIAPLLPKDKPCYLMGVGEPEDIIFAVKEGIDMFDCVLPTRLGRHGTVWVTSDWEKFEKMDLRKTKHQNDKKVIMKNCGCPACEARHSRSYISHLLRNNEMLGMRLASLHNLYILSELTKRIRENITKNKI